MLKNWRVAFNVAICLLSHINGYIIYLFSTFSLSFLFIFYLINFTTYCYAFKISIIFTFSYPDYYLSWYHFFLIPLSSFIFLFFLFLTSYYKSTILFSILFIDFFTHKRFSLSLSLSHFRWNFLYFSCISTLGWWIFVLIGTLLWVDVINFCVLKLLSFYFLWFSSKKKLFSLIS